MLIILQMKNDGTWQHALLHSLLCNKHVAQLPTSIRIYFSLTYLFVEVRVFNSIFTWLHRIVSWACVSVEQKLHYFLTATTCCPLLPRKNAWDHYILCIPHKIPFPKNRAPDWCSMFMLTATKQNISWPKCPVCYSLFWRCSWLIWRIPANEGYQPMLHTDNSTMSTSFAWLTNSFFPGFYSLKQNK